MNAERLLALYERVAKAPDAITRLRRFILDLAVRGKLVPQDPNDEPASELLKRIAKEKARLDRKERIKREPRSHDADAEPMQIPQGWALAPLADLVTVLNGRAYKQNELLSAGTPVLRVGNLFTSDKWYYSTLQLDEEKYCKKGDLIFAWSASFGPFIWDGERVIYHYHIWKLPLHSDADLSKLFLYNFLLQKTRQIKEAGHGISMIHMTKEKMEKIVVPLPPLAEQHRIVAKVDELMALCDRLEAAQKDREAKRDRLSAASLARLNAPDPETFQSDARFTLNALPALTTRPNQIKQLRQTILNLAVRGKLVPQDPNDEPASELLKRIAKEKARQGIRTINSVYLSTGKLPKGWTSTTIGNYANDVFTGPFGSMLHQSDYVVGGTPLVNPSHMKSDRIEHDPNVSVDAQTAKRMSAYALMVGDIVMARRGEVGRAALVEHTQDGWLCGTGSFFLRFLDEVNRHFFLLLLRTSELRAYLTGNAAGTTMVNLNHGILKNALLFMPPLAEQHRIVAKVDELMALCDRLEASLTISDQTRTRLLDGLLAEALAPEAMQ